MLGEATLSDRRMKRREKKGAKGEEGCQREKKGAEEGCRRRVPGAEEGCQADGAEEGCQADCRLISLAFIVI